MAEYIDREALIQELDAKLCALHSELDENRIVYDAFTDGFEECVGDVGKFQFAADVATVVRCKDCKKLGTGECPMEQDYPWISTDSDDFCSYGERRNYD